MRSAVLDSRSQPIRNLIINPRLKNISGWSASRVSVAAGQGPDGLGGSILTVTESGYIPRLAQFSGSRFPVSPGVRTPFHVWMKALAGVSLTVAIQYFDAAGAVVSTPEFNVPATGLWQQVDAPDRVTIAPANAARAGVFVGVATGTAVGTVAEVAKVWTMDTPYSDGDTPGWRWIGASGNSESAGYPYTLESVAGGSPVIDSMGAVTEATPGRTYPRGVAVYSVMFRPILGDDLTIALRDAASTQRISLRGTNGTQAIIAAQAAGGGQVSAGVPEGMPQGINVIAGSMPFDQGNVRGRHHASATDVRSPGLPSSPATFFADTVARARSGSAGVAHIRFLVFDIYHDAILSTAVVRWLTNMYGAIFVG